MAQTPMPEHALGSTTPENRHSMHRRIVRNRYVYLALLPALLLVLDDLGTESASPWAQEKLFQLFNYRYVARLPTVITMTQEPKDVDPRLRTRMTDVGRCNFFAIDAPSYRGSPQRRQERKSYVRSRRSRK